MPRPFEAHGRRKIQDLNGFDMRDLCSGKSGSLPSFHLLGTVGHTIDGTLCAEDDKVLSKLHLCVILQGESKLDDAPWRPRSKRLKVTFMTENSARCLFHSVMPKLESKGPGQTETDGKRLDMSDMTQHHSNEMTTGRPNTSSGSTERSRGSFSAEASTASAVRCNSATTSLSKHNWTKWADCSSMFQRISHSRTLAHAPSSTYEIDPKLWSGGGDCLFNLLAKTLRQKVDVTIKLGWPKVCFMLAVSTDLKDSYE